MECGFGRSHASVLIYLSVFVAVSLLFCTAAGAYIYDDFNGVGINTSKWTISDPGGLFSQPGDGRLHFGPITGAETTGNERIVSTRTFEPGFFSMEFYYFSSTNLQLPGSHQGAFAALGLTDGTNFVRIIRDQNGDGTTGTTPVGVFEVNYIENGQIQVHYVKTEVTQGQLGLYYDGTQVTFYYNSALDPDSGWQNTGWSGGWVGEWTPNWTSNPWLYIQGYDLYGCTSFSVDNVEYTPVPEPSTLLLLGFGLIGLAGYGRRRFFRK